MGGSIVTVLHNVPGFLATSTFSLRVPGSGRRNFWVAVKTSAGNLTLNIKHAVPEDGGVFAVAAYGVAITGSLVGAGELLLQANDKGSAIYVVDVSANTGTITSLICWEAGA